MARQIKYIRTNGEIYKVLSTLSNGSFIVMSKIIDKKYVIGRANNVKDLCDVIVLIDGSGFPKIFEYKTDEQKARINDVLNLWDIREIYLAILTNQGIIYKARIDENKNEVLL